MLKKTTEKDGLIKQLGFISMFYWPIPVFTRFSRLWVVANFATGKIQAHTQARDAREALNYGCREI